VFYYALRTLGSTEFTLAMSRLLKFIFPLLLFRYLYFESKITKQNFINGIFAVTLLFCINFFISAVFGLGDTVYDRGSESFNSGNFSASILYTGSVCIICWILLSGELPKNKSRIAIVSSVLIFLFLVLSLRRTALIFILIGSIPLVFKLIKSRKFYSRLFVVGTLILVLFAYNWPSIQNRIESRADRFEEGAIQKEGRYVETLVIWSNILSFEDVGYSLFGRESFNSAGNYGYPDSKRLIHTDINQLLSGGGLMGVLFYLLFFVGLFVEILRFKQLRKSNIGKYWYLALSLTICSLAVSFSSGLLAITYRTVLFSSIAFSLSLIRKEFEGYD
jgi:hypothetical protein